MAQAVRLQLYVPIGVGLTLHNGQFFYCNYDECFFVVNVFDCCDVSIERNRLSQNIRHVRKMRLDVPLDDKLDLVWIDSFNGYLYAYVVSDRDCLYVVNPENGETTIVVLDVSHTVRDFCNSLPYLIAVDPTNFSRTVSLSRRTQRSKMHSVQDVRFRRTRRGATF